MIDYMSLATDDQELSEDELKEIAAELELEEFLREENHTFENETLRTKAALRESVEKTRQHYQEEAVSGNGTHSDSFYSVLDCLLSKFSEELITKTLPEPLNDWWSYSYVITSYGVKLLMNYHSWSHSYEGSFDCLRTDEITVFEVPAKMLTVSEYASMNGVEPVTVRQWIRRAKIRSAVKYGREWRIPELAEMPKEKSYIPCHYYWKSTLTDLPEKFEYLNEFKSAYIDQDESDKDRFLLSLSVAMPGEFSRLIDAIGGTGSEVELDRIQAAFKDRPDAQLTAEGKLVITSKERAELELYMIGNPLIQCQTLSHHNHQIDEIGADYCGVLISVSPAE